MPQNLRLNPLKAAVKETILRKLGVVYMHHFIPGLNFTWGELTSISQEISYIVCTYQMR